MRTRLLFLSLMLAGVLAHAQSTAALLEQAQKEATAGNKEQAIAIYRDVLSADPNDVTALSACSELLEAKGSWREAVPLLTRLVELQPDNAQFSYRLGRMESWTDDGLTQATALLKRAVAADPNNPDYKLAYAEVLSRTPDHTDESVQILQGVVAAHPEQVEARRLLARMLAQQHKTDEALQVLQPLLARPNPQLQDYEAQAEIEEIAGNRGAATGAYRAILALDPNNLAAITKLAEVLSWNESTRRESIELYERGEKLNPENVSIAVAFAELLSWNQATRPRAIQLFDGALAHDPDNPRALNGKAQLLAWNGHSQDALALYDKVLAKNPANPDALRGKAEILDWRGRYAQSRALLARAHEIAPDDPRTNLEMARANVGLHRYSEARENLSMSQGLQGPDFNGVLQDVHRGLGTYMELGYVGRRNRHQLDFNRLDARLSLPLNAANRLTFDFAPTLYSTVARDFNSNHFGAALDSELNERLGTHAELSADQYPGEPSELNTALTLRFRPRDSWTLQGGFERQPVAETLLSTRGLNVGSALIGHVQSNLASLGANYTNSVHHYDASVTYTDGVYTGSNLDSNRRWELDLNLGKSVRGSNPYIRIAYGVTYLSFDHDADFQIGEAAPNVTGGYYSPKRFLLNYGGLSASHKFSRKMEWDAAATAGVQNAETSFTRFSSAQFASTFATHAVWHVDARNDIRGGYDFLNVFNAFHRHLFQIAWRHYF